MNYQQQQRQRQIIEQQQSSTSCCNRPQPLHSKHSEMSSISTVAMLSMISSINNQNKKRKHSKCHLRSSSFLLFIMTSLLLSFSSSLSIYVNAKYHLIPKRRTKSQPQTNHNKKQIQNPSNSKTIQKQGYFHKSTSNPPPDAHHSQSLSSLIVLKPKSKQIPPTKLKLEGKIHTNDNGEKVLLLSPESSQTVHSAMGMISEVEKNSVSLGLETLVTEEESSLRGMSKGGEDGAGPNGPKVLFYDPDDLKTNAGEEPQVVPKRVFDEHGNDVDMTGKDALLVKPRTDLERQDADVSGAGPKTNNQSTPTTTTTTNTILESQSTTQQNDQMIIISTVATMALLVGALSARRLRSKQFLSFCIENESLEDELAYDAAFTTQSTVGGSSFYGGGGGGYDTFVSGKYGGDLRWRGDLEKFDV